MGCSSFTTWSIKDEITFNASSFFYSNFFCPTLTQYPVPASSTNASSSTPKRTHSDVDSTSPSNSEDEGVNLKSIYEKDQPSILSTFSSIKNAVQSFATHVTGGPHDDEEEDLEELQDFDEEFEDADDSPATL
jgi:hypothetical protein